MKFFVALICVFVVAYAAEDLVDDPEVQLRKCCNSESNRITYAVYFIQ